MVVQALLNCSTEQRATLQSHYGKNNEEDIFIIRNLYEDLRLKDLFSEFEEKSYSKLHRLINSYTGPLHKDTFNAITKQLYKRQNWDTQINISVILGFELYIVFFIICKIMRDSGVFQRVLIRPGTYVTIRPYTPENSRKTEGQIIELICPFYGGWPKDAYKGTP